MNTVEALSEKAVNYFLEGYNCAQSVLMTMQEYWGIRNELIPKIATAFGAGIGRCGSVCGALTAGVMAIGVKYGTEEPSSEKRLKAYGFARELYRQFEARHGSVLCKELIGYDLSDSRQLEKAYQSNIFEDKCPAFVRSVVQILLDFEV
ncbi:C_GCAxxG_C_C family protein [Candidatus Bathyarchaeota archaeon]|nr:C_GCAxxG_C_C family protein [Candidatus Bathyarchaeota archaeon]